MIYKPRFILSPCELKKTVPCRWRTRLQSIEHWPRTPSCNRSTVFRSVVRLRSVPSDFLARSHQDKSCSVQATHGAVRTRQLHRGHRTCVRSLKYSPLGIPFTASRRIVESSAASICSTLSMSNPTADAMTAWSMIPICMRTIAAATLYGRTTSGTVGCRQEPPPCGG